jgi:hypothetical protein
MVACGNSAEDISQTSNVTAHFTDDRNNAMMNYFLDLIDYVNKSGITIEELEDRRLAKGKDTKIKTEKLCVSCIV